MADPRRVGPGDAERTSPNPPPVQKLSAEEHGQLLAVGAHFGTYEARQLLGAGGMGEVYLARDERLQRDVAIKLLRRDVTGQSSSSEAQRRMLREAQAMAKISHPNIVTVYEVGTIGEQVFVAMEYVEGQTLRAWLRDGPRRRREILEVFIHAGRGLAAVHAAGLVHRDFKPDNAIVGKDGRVRVTDFGLAGMTASSDAVDAGIDAALTETVVGSASGTPAYMAPEQHERNAVDARADQFAFCVALWESLVGERPFAGATYAELRANVVAGKVIDPAGKLPGWIRDILRRGLAVAPAARYPSLTALLDALGRDPATRWRRGAIGAGVVVAAAGLFLAARHSSASPCGGMAAHLTGAWDPTVKAAIQTAFTATDRPYAADTFARLDSKVDAYADAWVAARGEACAATSIRHEQSEALLDLRMQCLDRRLGDLRALTALWAKAPDPEIVDRAVQAAARLEDLAPCADGEELGAAPPPARDPTVRAQLAALRSRLADIHALRLAGKPKLAMAPAEALVKEAEASGDPALELDADDELGNLQGLLRQVPLQDATLEKELRLAARLKNDRWSATILIRIAAQHGIERRVEQALAMRPAVEAAVLRAGDSQLLHGRMLAAFGELHLATKDYAQAEAEYLEAIAMVSAAPGHSDMDLAMYENSLAIVYDGAGRYEDERLANQRAVAFARNLLGPDHPWVTGFTMNLGNVYMREGRLDDALAIFQGGIVTWTKTFGPEARDLAAPLTNIGDIYVIQARYADAAASYERAVAIKEKVFGPESPQLISTLIGLGSAYTALGRFDDAAKVIARGQAVTEKTEGAESPDYASLIVESGRLARKSGQPAEADELARRGLALYEKVYPPYHPELVGALILVGECDLAAGKPRDAIPRFERALLIRAARGTPSAGEIAEAELRLAQARLAVDRSDVTVPALAKDAREKLVALGPRWAALAGEVDAFRGSR